MRWEAINKLAADEFRRLTGVKKPTFGEMVKILQEARAQKKLRGGRKNKLSIGNIIDDTRIFKRVSYLFSY